MMTVSGFASREQAIARAPYYGARGYNVALVEHRSERAGSCFTLRCTPVQS